MKKNEAKPKKKRSFLKLPSYPGGKQSFVKFISDNLVYPEQAIINKIEGSVHLEYNVDNLGNVFDVAVTRGIGYGCDEEAIRIIKLLKFQVPKNRGVRLKVHMKTRIYFKLSERKEVEEIRELQINYFTPEKKKETENIPPPSVVYTYNIIAGKE